MTSIRRRTYPAPNLYVAKKKTRKIQKDEKPPEQGSEGFSCMVILLITSSMAFYSNDQIMFAWLPVITADRAFYWLRWIRIVRASGDGVNYKTLWVEKFQHTKLRFIRYDGGTLSWQYRLFNLVQFKRMFPNMAKLVAQIKKNHGN